MNLLTYIKSFTRTVFKKDLEGEHDYNKDVLTSQIPQQLALLALAEEKGFIKNPLYKEINKTSLKHIDHPKRTLHATVRNVLPNITENISQLFYAVDKEFGKNLIPAGLNVGSVTLLALTDMAHLFTEYTEQALGECIETITDPKKHNATSLNKWRIQNINNNSLSYAGAIKHLAIDPKKFKKQLRKGLRIIVNEQNESVLEGTYPEIKKLPTVDLRSGFIGSPVLHLRERLELTYFAYRWDALTEKKHYLELQKLYLEAEWAGEHSTQLEKKIEVTKNRLTKIEYSLKNMRESVA